MRIDGAGAFAVAIGIVLLGLGLPRLAASLLLLPGDRVVRALQAGELPSVGDFDRALASFERAQAVLAQPRVRTDTALVLAVRSVVSKEPLDTWLDRAVNELELGLARTPANGYAAARLAYARALTGNRNAAAALHLSLVSTPNEARLYLLRTELGIVLWPLLSTDARRLVEHQIASACAADVRNVARVVAARGGVPIVRGALRNTVALRDAFDRELAIAGLN